MTYNSDIRIDRLEKRLIQQVPVLSEKEDPEHRARIARCRVDVNAFMEYCFTDEESGQRFVQGGIHRQWHAHADTYRRALIEAPREHGKTDQMCIGRIIWKLGVNPQGRHKVVCQDDDTAMKRLDSIKGHIQRNKRLREVFPALRPHPNVNIWSRHAIVVDRKGFDKDPSVEAGGVLSTGTGARADETTFDDVCDFRNTLQQPGLRDVVREAVNNVWLNQLTKRGRALYIYTPWHQDDCSAKLKQSRSWSLLSMPISDDMVPVWEAQWPTKRLQERREEIGERAFARGFRLVAVADEDILFRSIDRCIRSDLTYGAIDPLWPRFMGVDLGHSKRKAFSGVRGFGAPQKPYSVVFTTAVDPGGRRWPVEIRRGHWSGPDTAGEIIEAYKAHRPELVLIENNAYQNTILDWIKLVHGDASMPLGSFTTGTQKADESIGLPGLAAEFDAGAWVIPTNGVTVEDDDSKQIGNLWAWIKEMKAYPVGALSDTVMACWFAREATRERMGLSRLFDPEKIRRGIELSRQRYAEETEREEA